MSQRHNLAPDIATGRLAVTILLNFAITLVEVVGGVLSGSLSLISDALHNFSDGISVIISYLAVRLKLRQNSPRHTFGLKRAEIMAAIINSAVLLVISFYLFYEAFLRLVDPVPVRGGLVVGVALIGLAANLVGTVLLQRDAAHSLNIRSAYLHLLSDAASSAGVLLGGVAMILWRVYWVDPLLTVLIGLYVLKQSYGILSQAIHILMEGAPADVDLNQLKTAVEALPGVDDIHHIHIWTVGENDVHLDAHLNLQDMLISESDRLRQSIESLLHESFGIGHTTIQFECGQCPRVGLIKSHR